ncbi:MAG: hypothetical protein EOP38_01690 [Rubrivivax sp.]|nr:MAG: hypothetical protein EOP38_01690 [Rubrivivax sp.]
MDTFVDQGSHPELAQHAAQFQNLLDAGEQMFQLRDAREAKQGAQDRALGVPQKEAPTNAYTRGWTTLNGVVQGQQDMDKIRATYATGFDRSDLGGFDKWAQEQTEQRLKGMQPGPFLEAYKTKLAEGLIELRGKHSEEQKSWVVAKAETNIIDVLAGAIRAKAGQPVTPEDFLKVKQTIHESGLGVDDSRWDQLGQNALKVLAGEGNYQAIRAARKATAEGSKAFPTLGEDDLSALEHHAQTVFLQKQEAADKAVKMDYETRVSQSVSPLFIQAQSGDLEGAMAGFSKLVSGGMFAHSPLDIDKYQKALQSISDKAETVDQRERFIEAAEGARLGNWTASKIIHSGVHPSKIPSLLSMMGERQAEERRAMSEARADAREDRKLAVIRQPEFSASVKDVLSVIPEMDSYQKSLDFTGKKAQALRELRADANRELISFASQHGSDMEKYQEAVGKVREQVRKRAEAVMTSTKTSDILPSHIRYATKREFLQAYRSGAFPQDPQQVQEHITFYSAKERSSK